MEKALLYFISKFISVIASIFILDTANVNITFIVIATLSLSCVFVLEVLLHKISKNKKVIMVTIGITLITCIALGMDIFIPLFFVSFVQLIDIMVDDKMFYYVLSVGIIIFALIFAPNLQTDMIVFLLLAMILFCRIVIIKLGKYREVSESQKEAIIELNKKIVDIKSLTKTIKYTVSIEERNRIAARIHDQLGHGISGSIILLEASMMIMKDNQEKAVESIQKAISNLRDGVDDIRASLRDERAGRYLIGMNDINVMLEEFKVSYNKPTVFRTSGDMDMISLETWACIHDNVKECLTNVLKHSNATEFTLNIEVFKKIIKVEYKDNGSSAQEFDKGIGLESIEERTIHAKGRCFFAKGERGFCVTNIFTY